MDARQTTLAVVREPPSICSMTSSPAVRFLLAASAFAATAVAQHPTARPAQSTDEKAPMYVAPRSDESKQTLASLQLAPGLAASLVAAEPDLCNVVAFSIGDDGRILVSETFRIHDGVFDTREYMQWKDEDLACLTVEDRLAKYARHISSDLPKYEHYTERLKLLVDDNGDFVVDRSTVFADDLADLASGIASGALAVGKDVWFTNIPKLWRYRDADGDGVAEVRDVVFDGFGVHTSLIGHDLHGLVVGPDRRLYFSIGDRGFDVTTKEGVRLSYPHEGAVLRCELDGSRLEVVHRGLRNPQELAFDDRGNLFTGDNNSDGGDRARLVQIVEGADSGWRIGFQWLDDRGAWNRERMWHPQHEATPIATLPPIANFADGPSGLAFDPGQGLPARYRGCFFLCDFRGGSSYSGVHAIRLVEKGAGFELGSRERCVWNVLATDVDFGPDGAMYVSDWVSGWNKTGKGRIYRIEPKGLKNDMKARATARVLASDFAAMAENELVDLVRHQDRRVRQKAQFALVDKDARGSLLALAKDVDAGAARLCGVFGLGAIGRRDPEATAPLEALLADGDADVRAISARMLGDASRRSAEKKLVDALKDPAARVRREAALALARIGRGREGSAPSTTVDALLEAGRHDAGRDPVLRHAIAQALAATRAEERLLALRTDAQVAVRALAVLSLRNARDVRVAEFLVDTDASVRLEAARAIHDALLDDALPQLAATLGGDADRERLADEPFLWRALHAARLLGGTENAAAVARTAQDAALPTRMRIEAVRILAEWPAPHGQDRVLGNWRPSRRSDADRADRSFANALTALLADDALAEACADALARLGAESAREALASLAKDRTRPAGARTAALKALASLPASASAVDAVVASIGDEDPTELRTAAVALFAEREPHKAAPVLASLCQKASTKERQQAFASLGSLRDPAGAKVLVDWLARWQQGKVDAEVQLDLWLAAKARTEPEVEAALRAIESARAASDPLAAFRSCLDGGDAEAGRRVFFDHEATRCTRCHTAKGQGGNAGPVLDGVGSRATREHLLESLIAPGAKIAQGFATTVLVLHNGDLVSGVVTKDQDGMVEITGLDGTTQKVAADRIRERRTATESAMPAMGGSLDLRQLRDVVAFLASLRDAAK